MLSAKTKVRLTNALTRKSLADELEAALVSATPLSSKLRNAIKIALASKKAATDLIDAVESAGSQSLDMDTKRRIIVELASKEAGNELIAKAESVN